MGPTEGQLAVGAREAGRLIKLPTPRDSRRRELEASKGEDPEIVTMCAGILCPPPLAPSLGSIPKESVTTQNIFSVAVNEIRD